ncbi:MAG: rhomboid family intramembrane serine protease [Sulfuriflexus sp.]|nr:rhomboid family intramembrane serine protease [Sulfuriflexus sp.]
MLIPLNTDLRLGRRPWITWAIMLICIAVFYFQVQSNQQYEASIINYCQNISKKASIETDDFLAQNDNACVYLLHAYHIQTIRGVPLEKIEKNIFDDVPELSKDESLKFRLSLLEHHLLYSETAPSILDEEIMYFPRSFNPFTMISSSLAHGGFAHIIGNLIFFFAFSCAVELIIGGMFRYVLTLTVIAIGCSVFYSLFSLFEGGNIPGLGLSGVVMGVVGLSAYFMPKARVNTLIWFIIPIKRVAIPVWFLAIWFVGFDAWELLSEGMNQGVNLVAHVSGGVVGYLIGLFYFKERKAEIAEELDDEIEHMRSQDNSFAINKSANLNKTTRAIEKHYIQAEEKKQQGAYLDRLFNMVRTGQNSDAINLILADVDPMQLHPEHFLDIYNKIGEWKKQGAYLCMGRLMIDLYMQHRRYVDAFDIAKDCLMVTREFVLANSRDVLILAQEANRQGRYKLAVALLHDVESRYSEEVGYMECGLLEVGILINRLNMHKVANQCLEKLKRIANDTEMERISEMQIVLVSS